MTGSFKSTTEKFSQLSNFIEKNINYYVCESAIKRKNDTVMRN